MTKKHICGIGMLLLMSMVATKAQSPAGNTRFKDEREKFSYAFGMNLGKSWKAGQVDLDPETVFRGVKDALSGGATALTEKEMAATLAKFGRDLRVLQQQRRDQLAQKNLLEGEAFLATNKTCEGVVASPTGLQYKILARGAAGQSPDLTNWVKLKYRTFRINGAELQGPDVHADAGIFNLHGMIHGWSEALQLMKPGDKWRLFVPPDLAYGKGGSPEVDPNETLIYDLELLSILPAPPEPTAEDIKNERGPDGD
jgi:FKBP-type peptidyl-prolyl cis-trans isomerase